MTVSIEPLFPPTTKAAVAELEHKLKVPLPADYRAFLLEFNGGMPTPNAFVINDRQGESTLGVFFGLVEGDVYDLWSNALAAFEDMDRTMLAIGTDPGGNHIFLSLGEENRGRVFFRDHERDTAHGVFPIAASFTEFLAHLHPLKLD